METSQTYLDYAAATPVDSQVLAAMQPYFSELFYNPSSSYQAAREVREAVEDARTRVAYWLGAKTSEIIFTAGATESINLSIHGVMRRHPGAQVLVSAIEHEAVLDAARGYKHKTVAVRPDGLIDLEALKRDISDDTVLISVGYANNEIGVVQPLKDVAELVREIRRLRALKNNNHPLYLHADASQAACYLDLHASRLGVDLFTLNGGKMYGPKQTGVLFVSGGLILEALVAGGGQEMGLRSGTENVPGIVGLATALDIAQTDRKDAITKEGTLRDELQRRLCDSFPHMLVNGSQKKRLPNILNVSWPGVDGERLHMQLDERGIMASTGSACAANKQTASHVLKAIGLADDIIHGSLRLSVGRQTTQQDIDEAVNALTEILK